MNTNLAMPLDYSYDVVKEKLYEVRGIIYEGFPSQNVPNVILDLIATLAHLAVYPIEHDGVRYLKCAYDDLCNNGFIGGGSQ